MSREDELTQMAIEYHQDAAARTPEEEIVVPTPECPYDHYGNRGVVDLHLRRELVQDGERTIPHHDYVYEMKSDAAVREATGANEILRQFNRARQYFYRDDSRSAPLDVHFELLFDITPTTVRHIQQNYQLYHAVNEGDLATAPGADTIQAQVVCRGPEHGIPVLITNHDHGTWAEFTEFLEALSDDPNIERFRKVVREIDDPEFTGGPT